MAGEWIKMRGNLWDDPRVARLCELTDQSEAAIIGGLYWLWATADQHTEDGLMLGLTSKSIDRKTGIKGFADGLVQIGWLADHPEGVRIINFEDHNGSSAKRRSVDAQRKLNVRSLSAKARTECGQNAPNLGAREEKRREEVKPSNPDGLLVASDADDGEIPRPQKPDCPHKEIIAAYHEILPACPQIRDWTPARQAVLRARWNEDDKRQTIAWWREFFDYVSSCDFLVGKVSSHGGRPFFADLPWLLKAENFAKVREGRYEPN
jgi:hypothetical protein